MMHGHRRTRTSAPPLRCAASSWQPSQAAFPLSCGGRPSWGHASGPSCPRSPSPIAPILPSKGWRIYTVSGSRLDSTRRPGGSRSTGSVRKPLDLSYDELRSLPRVEQVSTFHCVTGWTVENVRWAGVRIQDVLAPAAPSGRARALRFVSAEDPYVDYLTLRAGPAARRDAGLRDGRRAAVAGARRAAPARDPGDVRLQERQVAGGITLVSAAARRLLGAARL